MKKKEIPAEETPAGAFIMGELRLRQAYGQDNAVPRAAILEALNRRLGSFELESEFKPITDEAFRSSYRDLPICSSEAGLYIPDKPADLDAFELYLKKKAMGLFRRIKIVQQKHPELGPFRKQIVLSFDDDAAAPEKAEALAREIFDKALAAAAGPRPCRTCGTTGKVVLGERLVTREMALDAGNLELEGTVAEIETATCPTCGGTGQIGGPGENTAVDRRGA